MYYAEVDALCVIHISFINLNQNWMQGHTDSTPRFGQNQVGMRTTSFTWVTTVQKATMDSCFALIWPHHHGIACTWTDLPKRIQRIPLMFSPNATHVGAVIEFVS